MCNAWNHRPNCTCGWGGWGATYSRGVTVAPTRLLPASKIINPIYAQGLASYTNPNAHCPVCGAQVFFYQSQDGGRVFFDHLGKPWPKHPCTDNSITGAPRIKGVAKPASAEIPFVSLSVHASALPDIEVLDGLIESGPLRLFCKQPGLSARAPFFVSPLPGGDQFRVSTVRFVGADVEAVEFLAFKSIMSLAKPAASPQSRPAKIPKTKNGKFVRDAVQLAKGSTTSTTGAASTSLGKPSRPAPPSTPTAIELAFQRAKTSRQ